MKKLYFILFFLNVIVCYAQNCNNIGFENGTTSGWQFAHANINGVNLPCDNCPDSSGAIATVVTDTSTVGTQCAHGLDFYQVAPVIAPSGGAHSLLLNNNNAGGKMQQASFTTIVNASTSFMKYQFAAVLQKAGDADSIAPYFSVYVYDKTHGYVISCTKYTSDSVLNAPGWQYYSTNPSVYCIPWTTLYLDLTAYISDSVTVVFTASDCSDGNHFGYAYIEASCNPNQIIPNPHLCGSNPATLHGPIGYATYSWLGPVTGNSQNLTTSTPGTYTLITTPFWDGCPSPYLFYSLTSDPAPTVNYNLAPDNAPHTWDVYPIYSSDVVQHSWDWGDATPADTGAYPSHTYAVPGKYNICVTATNNFGCSTTYCQNDSVYRLSNSNMVYVNVINSKQVSINLQIITP